MSQQTKILSYAQQRLDLGDYQALQDYVAADFQFLNKNVFAGETFILTGFEVSHIVPPSLDLRIAVANSVVMVNSDDGTMWVAPSGADPIDVTVGDGTTTYVWLTLEEITEDNATRTFWDPTANDGAGAEFNQAVDTISTFEVEVHTSTTGFPVGDDTVIHVCIAVSSGGDITSLVDHRKMFFRLGRGGDTIDETYDFPLTSEPDSDLEVDANAFTGGDKALATTKDWMDYVMTKIKEIQGTTHWTDDAPTNLATGTIAMTGGGTFTWTLGTNTLDWTGAISFLIPHTAFTNTVAIGNIVIASNDMVVYVDIDDTSNAVLTPVAVAASSFVYGNNRLIIARRISNVVYVGLD